MTKASKAWMIGSVVLAVIVGGVIRLWLIGTWQMASM